MTYQIVERLLTPNKFSRPKLPIRTMKGIVIHWVANPMTSAKNNRDFFESRKGGLKSYGSAHEIIDLDGSVYVCIPKNEIAYHVGSNLPYTTGVTQIYTSLTWDKLNTNSSRHTKPYPNNCTYGIETTHLDRDGRMTDATYDTLVERCADLCKEFKLNPMTDIYLHQEVVGWKDCHRWFVNHPLEWIKFKQKVQEISNEDEPMTKVEKEEFDKLKSIVEKQTSIITALHKTIKELQDKDIMKEVPDWSRQAVEAAERARLIDTPANGSYDFYRLLTILWRRGII
ncbi:N-acetylmuramoyl-L-alanine amidase family protein [Paenibacillus paeoniae]|nr:peptidoglycan recognition family protein [Paenibacillus paeoniae]